MDNNINIMELLKEGERERDEFSNNQAIFLCRKKKEETEKYNNKKFKKSWITEIEDMLERHERKKERKSGGECS